MDEAGGHKARRTHQDCAFVRDDCLVLHRVDERLEHGEVADDGHVVAVHVAPDCGEAAGEGWGL